MATNNAVNTSLSGQTGTGTFAGSTSATFVTPTLGAATATSVTFSPTTGGIVGTTTNNNGSAGVVGEFISSIVLSASPVSLSTATPANITSISLTAGDWDVWGNVTFITAATTVLTQFSSWVSSTSASNPGGAFINVFLYSPGITPGAGNLLGSVSPSQRFSLSGTTTVYLSCTQTFSTSTLTGCGGIYARRVR